MKDLRGKVVLITGASSGIGLACARAFAAEGCRLALAARRVEKVREQAPAGALALACDVRERSQVLAAVAETERVLGGVDVLVNNAGVLESGRLEEQDPAALEDLLRTNLSGAICAVQAVLPALRRRGGGHIVNVASVAGLIGLPYMAVYCASKFGLVGFTESLRRELHGSKITLTAFCPGLVRTPMAEKALGDPELSKVARPKTPEQVAARIVDAVRRRLPEVVYGDAPGLLVKATRFFPGLADAAVARAYRRWHPRARKGSGA